MSKRWLPLCVLILSFGWSRIAHATLTASPDPVNPGGAGGVVIGSNASADTALAVGALGVDQPIDAITPVGADCGAFAITAPSLPTTVTVLNGKTVTVKFTPVKRGTVSCTFNIFNGATMVGTFGATGLGLGSKLAASVASQDFGSVRVNGGTQPHTIRISNSGESLSMVVQQPTITGDTGDFSITTAPAFPATVPAGMFIDITVTFDPTVAGSRSASLAITSNASDTPNATIPLTGIGTTAQIQVTDLDFGTVTPGTTAVSTISVSNAGAAPQGALHVSLAAIGPPASTWFSFDANGAGCLNNTTCFGASGFNVPPTKLVSVQCKPPLGATGAQTGTVTFTSDSDSATGSVANLTCTAAHPNIMVSTATLTYGNQLVPTASTAQTVTIMNTGNAPLTYSIVPSGAAAALAAYSITTAAGCTSNCSLAMGTGTTFAVTFTPTAPGAANITININSNDPDPGDNVFPIAVTGTGIAPQISPPGTVAFGMIDVGKTSGTMALTVTNTGAAPLTITNAAFTPATTDFAAVSGTIGAQTTVVTANGGTASWDITCSPQAPGARGATFRIQSNSFSSSTVDIVTTCTGLAGILATVPASPAQLDFGPVAQNTTVTLPYVLKNTGNTTVTGITAMLDITNTGYSLDATTPVPATLTANQQVTLNIKFTPLTGTDGGIAHVAFSGVWGSSPQATTMATLVLNGDGLTAGFDVSPAAVDFGSLRFDTTVTRTFCILNTDQASIQVLSPLTIVPDAGTTTGELTVIGIKAQSTCGVGGSTVSLPQTVAPGGVLEVTVLADPANRTGLLGAVLTVTTNLGVNPTRAVTLMGTSTTAMLSTTVAGVQTMMLDYGAVDIDLPAAAQTITITNTGAGPLDLSGFARTANASFSLTLPANQTLAPGGHIDIPVTYDPTVERIAGQEETIQLTHNIAGILGGPAMQVITIRGRGINRHLVLGPAPVFPATFRNPGDAAPVRSVMVTNTGEAKLNVSMISVNDAEIWQLLDQDPVDINQGETKEFRVKFAPKIGGKAPTGLLMLVNNDKALGSLAIVNLDGDGLDRNVSMSDPVIDLGYTGIGIPLTKSNVLSVTSMDSANGFVIHAIELDDASVFSIENAPTDAALAPGGSQAFSLTFTPNAEGDFETKAHLFLDMDPTQQAEVTIKGHAVYVDVHGGGGCSTGKDLGGGALVLLGALALRRRRKTAALVVGIALAILPTASRADDKLSLDLSLFHPTPATTGANFQLQSASVGDDGMWVGSAMLSYAANPLVFGVTGADHIAITRRATLDVGGAYAFLGRFEAGLHMPLYNQNGEGPMYGVPTPQGSARGDLVLHAKARLWRGLVAASDLVAGASLHVTLPTATASEFAGVDKPTARLLGLATMTPAALHQRISISLNAGAVIRARSKFANIDQGSGLAWGLGGSYRVLDALWATAELFGDVVPAGHLEHPAPGQTQAMAGSSVLSSVEYLVGVSYRMERRITVGLAVGRGLNAGIGTSDARGVFTLAIAPGAELAPIAKDPPPVDGDADGDGIADSVDRCPHEPEDKDMFDDGDGCPDPDNDHDGIPDTADKCPLDAEDKDGFEDDDGCPDLDNDHDGIPDATDKCPNEPEDKDGFQDLDGCPDPDNDFDGIPDATDKCPNEPETINGNQDDDGCPDRGDALVVLTPAGLETLESIQFNGPKVGKQSTNVLGQVAATLRARSEIIRLKIISHVQPTNDSDKDQELSDKRAEAVRDWFVQWGIAPARLIAKGMGSTKPLVPKEQRGSAALNDRIELIILERR